MFFIIKKSTDCSVGFAEKNKHHNLNLNCSSYWLRLIKWKVVCLLTPLAPTALSRKFCCCSRKVISPVPSKWILTYYRQFVCPLYTDAGSDESRAFSLIFDVRLPQICWRWSLRQNNNSSSSWSVFCFSTKFSKDWFSLSLRTAVNCIKSKRWIKVLNWLLLS